MDLKYARREVQSRPLVFLDIDQIAAYEHMERVAEIERALAGDDSEEHMMAVSDAIQDSGWLDLLTGKTEPEWRGH